MDVAVIIERILPLYYTIIICGIILCLVLCLEGKVIKGIVIFTVLFYFSILITDLRTDFRTVRDNFEFSGVIFPTVEAIEITMPVFFEEICNTGVITGGYNDDSSDSKEDNRDVLDNSTEGVVSSREV